MQLQGPAIHRRLDLCVGGIVAASPRVATEARGVWKELQISSNLHNLAGIVRTKRNQSDQGRLRSLLFRRRIDPERGRGTEAVLTDA